MSEPQGDDPFKADKRTDETVMISSDDLGGMVADAKAGAQPAASSEPAPAPSGDAEPSSGPPVGLIVLIVAAVIAVILVAIVAFG